MYSRGKKLVELVVNKENLGARAAENNIQSESSRMTPGNDIRDEEFLEIDNSSSLNDEQNSVVRRLEELYGSDFSDDDPTYIPPSPKRNRAQSESPVSLITLEDLLGENCEIPSTSKDPVVIISTSKNSESDYIENWIETLLYDIVNDVLKNTNRSRWKNSAPNNWKKNIAKKRRTDGLSYTTKNKKKNPKVPQNIDCGNCTFKCTDKISHEERDRLCRIFWNLDFKAKKNFILSNVSVNPPKRLLTSRTTRKPRSFSKKCFFGIGDAKIQVCQNFFCKTLCISKDVIQDAVKNRDPLGGNYANEDRRGKAIPPNKTKPNILQNIKDHIQSYPTVQSHYVRKKSKKLYLDSSLNICKMYYQYKQQCIDNGLEYATEITYRRIFGSQYNLSFFKPKKDQCLICSRYARACSEEKKKLNQKFVDHQNRKRECNYEKEQDKIRANSDSSFMSLTFDIQAVLQIPYTQDSLLYYSRKINTMNLTVYEAREPNTAYCFPWTEINGKKGSCEVASILLHYLSKCLDPEITHVTLFSDTCGGQNRNQFVAILLLWCAQTLPNLNIIEQKFLEPGHTYMEVDSMHSAIESAKKNSNVYSMIDWIQIFRRARKQTVKKDKATGKKITVEPYRVKEFKFNEFYDIKLLAEKTIKNRTIDNEGSKVNWLKIKRLKFVKGENTKIYFSYSMNGQIKHIDINVVQRECASNKPRRSVATRRKPQPTEEVVNIEMGQISLTPLYNSPLPISAAKKKDLVTLCRKGVIPDELHTWFNGLVTSTDVIDTLIQPDLNDSDTEEEDLNTI